MLFVLTLAVVALAIAWQWSRDPGEEHRPLPIWEADEDLPPAPRRGLPDRPNRTTPGEKR